MIGFIKAMEDIYGEWIDFATRDRDRIFDYIFIHDSNIVVYFTD